MIADAYIAKQRPDRVYWLVLPGRLRVLARSSVKQVIIYGDTSLDLQLRRDLPGIDPAKTFVASSLKRP